MYLQQPPTAQMPLYAFPLPDWLAEIDGQCSSLQHARSCAFISTALQSASAGRAVAHVASFSLVFMYRQQPPTPQIPTYALPSPDCSLDTIGQFASEQQALSWAFIATALHSAASGIAAVQEDAAEELFAGCVGPLPPPPPPPPPGCRDKAEGRGEAALSKQRSPVGAIATAKFGTLLLTLL